MHMKKRTAHLAALGRSEEAEGTSIESCLRELEALCGGEQKPPSATDGTPGNVLVKYEALRAESQQARKRRRDESNGEKKPELSAHDRLWDPSLPTTPMPRQDDMVRDRARQWNRALRVWMTRGSYTPGLLPSLELEVFRHIQVEKLSSDFLEKCPELRMPAFERWLIDSKLEETLRDSEGGDPVLSITCHSNTAASQRLADELRGYGMDTSGVKQVVKDLCRKCSTAASDVVAQSVRLQDKVPFRKGERIELEYLQGNEFCSFSFHCKRWKKPFRVKLTRAHYVKLRDQFLSVHNQPQVSPLRLSDGGKPTKVLHCFHYLVMTVVLRYASLSGGQLLRSLRGGGMQGAVNGALFGALHSLLPHETLFESFASPLNSYVSSYGSAFFELDWHFGSIGNFLQLTFMSGICEANPPFSPGLMDVMVDRLEENIKEANERNQSLSFVVIVPTVPDDASLASAAVRHAAPSFRRMVENTSKRCHVRLLAREHGYVEGSQHLRPTRYKESFFETTVILLQSERARQEPFPTDFEHRVRSAMRSRAVLEVTQRKHRDADNERKT